MHNICLVQPRIPLKEDSTVDNYRTTGTAKSNNYYEDRDNFVGVVVVGVVGE
jgi:hypothetical protein